MSDTLRILLFFAALVTGGWIVYKIRKLQVKMQDAIFWVIFAVILFILGIFPQAGFWLTERLGIMSPANLIFLVIIFLLMEKVFTLSIIVSQLEEKISILSAEIALRSNAMEKRMDEEEQVLCCLKTAREEAAANLEDQEKKGEKPSGRGKEEQDILCGEKEKGTPESTGEE